MPQIVERLWEPTSTYGVPQKDKKPFLYGAFIPDSIAGLDPRLPSSVAALIEEAASGAAQLDSSPGIDDLEPLARVLLRTESVASSRIEGLHISHRRLEEAIVAPSLARGAALSIVKNIEAMASAISLGDDRRPLRVDDILTIHAALLNTPRDAKIAGVLRTEQNWIGGGSTPRAAQFVPPPPDNVPELVADLAHFCNRSDLPAITQAAIAHAQFETIHPFADGNGRTGRCLIHVILRRRALSQRVVPPVSVVLAANASRYIEGLTAFRAGDLVKWCEIFAEATTTAALGAIDLGTQLRTLRTDLLARAGNPRKGSAARRLIETLASHPLLSVDSAAQILGSSAESARLALAQLAESGVVTQFTKGRRNRAWVADEVFDLLDDFDFKLASGDAANPARPAPTRHLRPR